MPRFVDNIAAAVDKVGVEKVGLIFGLGQTPWASEADRDYFLDMITREG